MSHAATDHLPDDAPVPRSALGPTLNEHGHYVGRFERTPDWTTDGTRQSAGPMAVPPVRDPVGDLAFAPQTAALAAVRTGRLVWA
jgi:hypothetical protein